MNSKKTRIQIWSERILLLVFAPLAIALIANSFTSIATSQPTAWWLLVVTVIALFLAVFLYLVVYTNLFNVQLSQLEQKLRARRFEKPRVLVLDGTLRGGSEEKPTAPLHTNKAPNEWRSGLERFGWKVELGPVQRIREDTTPEIVLNPFGESYPEENFISLSTASTIREYVWEGGIYVNVAGIPFWYCHDPMTGASEVAGRMEKKDDNKPVWKPLFKDRFPDLETLGDRQIVECKQNEEDLQRFGDIANAGNTNKVGKFRAYPSSSGRMTPLLREKGKDFYLIGGVLSGQGSFIFAGVYIDDTNSSFDKVIAAIKGWAEYESRGRKP